MILVRLFIILLCQLLASTAVLGEPCKGYYEDFNGDSGWVADRARPLFENNGTGKSIATQGYDLWSIDHYHAPPDGPGYLHILMWLPTGNYDQFYPVFYGQQKPPFIKANCSTNLTSATLRFKYRAVIKNPGPANIYLWVQAVKGDAGINYRLRKPVPVSPEWRVEEIRLQPDPNLWVCMRGASYMPMYTKGCEFSIGELLKDVNRNILFVLFPLALSDEVAQKSSLKQRPMQHFTVDREALPSGYLEIDWITIDYK